MGEIKLTDVNKSFGSVHVLKDIDLHIKDGEFVVFVGPSGCGKSTLLRTIAGLEKVTGGEIQIDGKRVNEVTAADRGLAMVFQSYALYPHMSVRQNLAFGLENSNMPKAEVAERIGEAARMLEIEPYLERRPGQLSGGQRQRAMIAMALACRPKLLIADEPTTALDVTIQVQIVELLNELQREENMAVLMITHDLNLVRHFADRVGVMEKGRLIETADTDVLFAQPREVYTRKLLSSRPERMVTAVPDSGATLLKAEKIRCTFSISLGWFKKRDFVAVDDIDVHLHAGETLGIVGESGSGKSTLGMALLRLSSAKVDGRIEFDSHAISDMDSKSLRPLRAKMQVVFQDPFASLSPRRTIEQIIGEGLELHQPQLSKAQVREAIAAGLSEVGLRPDMMSRYPHEFSGGQRQRIAIARVLVLKPKLILLDEPTSSLDVSVQLQVLRLLADLQQKYGLAYLFISHDLAVIRAMAHRVMVMKDGKVVENGSTADVLTQPEHPYTQRLLAASTYSVETEAAS